MSVLESAGIKSGRRGEGEEEKEEKDQQRMSRLRSDEGGF